jgi:hypothetical protein
MVGGIPQRRAFTMLRQSLLLGVATVAFAGAGQAQQRGASRDDLLDALTRHIQICGEQSDTQARLACYDRLQTQVDSGGGSAPAAPPAAQLTPTPLQAAPPASTNNYSGSNNYSGNSYSNNSGGNSGGNSYSGNSSGGSISSAPLTPQPLGVPGGGTATLGGNSGSGSYQPAPPAQDPDAAYDPRTAGYRPPENAGPKPQPQLRRTGRRPIPPSSTPRPLVQLAASNLTYGDTRYWQVTVTLTSNTPNPVNAQAECTFMNAGRQVATDYLGPLMIQPGEQITTELIGPPTTSYVDSSNCRLVSP